MENNIEYLLKSYSTDDLLRQFHERSGKVKDFKPTGAQKFWEEDLAGSNAGRFLMGAANTLRWIDREVEELIVRMAEENRSWGYDRIVGALANLGHEVSDQTVGNVLRRHGVRPAPARKQTTTWAAFIRAHLAVLAGTDFFTVEVLTLRGLVTYYVLFFIHL